MKYKEKTTGIVVEAKNYEENFAFSHNSKYEKVVETETKPKASKPVKETKDEVKREEN